MKYTYLLFSTTVIYVRDKLERQRHLNVMIVSDTPYVTRQHLNQAQQQSQMRFMKEFDPKREAKIVDVFIGGISNLGQMTEQEFMGEDLVNQDSEADQEASAVPVEPEIEAKLEQAVVTPVAEAASTEADSSSAE